MKRAVETKLMSDIALQFFSLDCKFLIILALALQLHFLSFLIGDVLL